jgi:hypothetical protein
VPERLHEQLSGNLVSTREKLILAGLYLSRYDLAGVRKLGFASFTEAYNVIGFALGSQPASIKNYRDEFDPLVSNRRKGWHKRPFRDYCHAVFQDYESLDFESFTDLINLFLGYGTGALGDIDAAAESSESASAFAQRLITGLAAEQYFESVRGDIPEFRDYLLENTTRHGCGYDFRLTRKSDDREFLAVEVKGLRDQTGSVSMTPKEYLAAEMLKDRFFLFVVSNFRKAPSHQSFQNPLSGGLEFRRVERIVVQVSWLATV